jgi:hypothetical protein
MDKIAIAGLVVGVVSGVAAIVAAIAAVRALCYAKDAPTKEDLGRVESNIAQVEGHLSEQKQRDSVISRAERVSMSVKGSSFMSEPLNLVFTLEDASVTLLRIDLINGLNMLTGVVDCSPSDPLSFTATIDPTLSSRWFGSGESHQSVDQKLTRIRAFMMIDGQEVYKTFLVLMSQRLQPVPNMGSYQQIVTLSGTC